MSPLLSTLSFIPFLSAFFIPGVWEEELQGQAGGWRWVAPGQSIA